MFKEKKRTSKIEISTLPITSIVFLIFLVMKLANIGMVATWSWIWIFFSVMDTISDCNYNCYNFITYILSILN